MHFVCWAFLFAEPNATRRRPARIPLTATTVNNSSNVKALIVKARLGRLNLNMLMFTYDWTADQPFHHTPILSRNNSDGSGSATVPVALVGPRASVLPTICSDFPPASRTMILPTPLGAGRRTGGFSARRRKRRSRRPRYQSNCIVGLATSWGDKVPDRWRPADGILRPILAHLFGESASASPIVIWASCISGEKVERIKLPFRLSDGKVSLR
jgi:hypothetical protein